MSWSVDVNHMSPNDAKGLVSELLDSYGAGRSKEELASAQPAINGEIDRAAEQVSGLGGNAKIDLSAHGHASWKSEGDVDLCVYAETSIKVCASRV